jgi:ribose 5-phosphate isomerase A
MTPDDMKREAARAALTHVESGMRLGLGHGSTAKHFVDLLGEKVRDGLKVLCVPASDFTHDQAQSLDIPLTTLDETPQLDLCVDGADEIGPGLSLIKGGGGALLREKIVAAAAHSMIVIADESKIVATLGHFPLPVEVVPFGFGATKVAIERAASKVGISGELVLRMKPNGLVFVTDGGHHILDCHFKEIRDPAALAAGLSTIPGVVEHGLFLGYAKGAYVAGTSGVRYIGPA